MDHYQDQDLEERLGEIGDGSVTKEAGVDSKPLRYKLMALVVALFFSMGSHYATNNLNTLKKTFKDELGVTNTAYGVVQSTVYLINTLIPLVGGMGMDRYGTVAGSLASSTFILLGNILVAIGCSFKGAFYVIIMGRVLHGFGSGMIVVAQETILGKWFSSSNMALVIGLQIGASRASDFCATFFANMIAKKVGLSGAMWVSAFVCLLSSLVALLYAIVLRESDGENIPQEAKRASFSPRRLLCLPVGFWIMPFSVLVLAGIWTPFLGSMSDFIQATYPTNSEIPKEIVAGWQTSVSLLISIFLSPFLGFIIDSLGHRSPVSIASAVLTATSLLMLTFTTNKLYPALVLFSIAFTIGPVALTSSIPLMLPSELIGTGIGAHKSAMSVGITFLHLLIGLVQDATPGRTYDRVMTMLLIVSAIGIAMSLISTYHSYFHMKRLFEVPSSQRRPLLDTFPDTFKDRTSADLPHPSWKQKFVSVNLIAICWIFFITTLFLNTKFTKKFSIK